MKVCDRCGSNSNVNIYEIRHSDEGVRWTTSRDLCGDCYVAMLKLLSTKPTPAKPARKRAKR